MCQQQQRQIHISLQNTFHYEVATFVVLMINKEVSDLNEPSLWMENVLEVCRIKGESFARKSEVRSFDTTEDSEKDQESLLKKLSMLENSCFLIRKGTAVQ